MAEEKPSQKIKIVPDHIWNNYKDRQLKEAIHALFLNNEKVFNLFNNTNPSIKPAIISESGAEEFAFMMGEI